MRRPDEEADSVLVIRTVGTQRRTRRRRRRGAPAGEATGPEVPLSRVTIVTPLELGSAAEARVWLDKTSGDGDAAAGLCSHALALLNRAIHVQRAASGDPYVHEVSERSAITTRIGYGTGDEVADGRWDDAREVPPERDRQSRADELTPQLRVAAVLGGKENVDACETLVLRARMDLDNGRWREAALQIRVGAEALLAELGDSIVVEQADDLAALDALRHEIGAAANAALRGELAPEEEATVSEAVKLADRILRRRRLRTG